MREVDELLYAEIAEHRRRDDLADRDDILSALILARFEDGDGMTRHRSARPADDPAARRPRDHRDRARLDVRPAAAPPGGRWARLRDSLEDGEDEYLRATITESLRLRPVVPLAGRRLATELVADGMTLPAGTDVTPAIWLAHTRADVLSRALRLPPRALPRGGAGHLRLDPLRRQRAPLHRRRLRRVRDADRPARGAHPLRAAQVRPGAGAGRAAQRHPLARATGPGSCSARATRPARASRSPPSRRSARPPRRRGSPAPSGRSCPSRRSPRRRRGRGSAPRWCRSAA